jgi:hypothetical protein
MTLYKQCRLRRGNCETMAWIPSTLAVIGKRVAIKEKGEWDGGWIVASAGHAQNRDDKNIRWPPLDPRMTRL